MIGAVLTGVFCVPSLGGLVEGVTMGGQVVAQIKGVLFTSVYCFVVSWIILKVVKALIGLRADERVEEMGLDLAEHNESAYNYR
ncbi:Ammonia channel precursor [compost metagenome]